MGGATPCGSLEEINPTISLINKLNEPIKNPAKAGQLGFINR